MKKDAEEIRQVKTVEVPLPELVGRFVTDVGGRPVAMIVNYTDVEVWDWLCERCPEPDDVTSFSVGDLTYQLGLSSEQVARRAMTRFRRAGLVSQVHRTDQVGRTKPPLTVRVWPNKIDVGDVFLQVQL